MSVRIEHIGQGALEALLVHAAFGRVDVIGEREDVLIVAVVVLQSHLGHGTVPGAGHVDHLIVQHILIGVEIGNKLPDTAFKAHLVALFPACAQVDGANAQSGIQKRLLPHTGVEHVIVVYRFLKHLRVGLESHSGTGVIRAPNDLHFLDDVAPGKFHLMDFAVAVHLYRQPFAQGVDHAGAHAMQTAGYLISPAAEFSAGMEHGIHHLKGGPPGLRLDIYGNAAAVVCHGDGIALVDLHGNIGAIARQGFVNGVVHDFIDQMMQTAFRRGADIHPRTLTYSLQSFEHLNLGGIVFVAFVHAVRLFRLVLFDPLLLFFVHTGTS